MATELRKIATVDDMSSFTEKKVFGEARRLNAYNSCMTKSYIESKYFADVVDSDIADNQFTPYDAIVGVGSEELTSYTMAIVPLILHEDKTITACTLSNVTWTVDYGDGTSGTGMSTGLLKYIFTDGRYDFPETVVVLSGGSVSVNTQNASGKVYYSDGTNENLGIINAFTLRNKITISLSVSGGTINPPDPTGSTTTTVTFEATIPVYCWPTLYDVITTADPLSNEEFQSINAWVMPLPPVNPDIGYVKPTFVLYDVEVGSTLYYKSLAPSPGLQAQGLVGTYKVNIDLINSPEIGFKADNLSPLEWNSVVITRTHPTITIDLESGILASPVG